MTTTADASALLAAVALHPDDDTPRLVYADWLQENGGTMACPNKDAVFGPTISGSNHVVYEHARPSSRWVKCRTCYGSGGVPDATAARAEFIRVQVELARAGPPHKRVSDLSGEGRVLFPSRGGPGYYEFTMLRDDEVKADDRIDFLRHAEKPRWVYGLRVVRVIADSNPGIPHTAVVCKDERSGAWPGTKLAARADELLRAHEAAWRGRGVGTLGALAEMVHGRVVRTVGSTWKHPATWVRGFPTVTLPLVEIGVEDGGVWKPTPFALACKREAAWLVPGDREPVVRNFKVTDGALVRWPAWACSCGTSLEEGRVDVLPLSIWNVLGDYMEPCRDGLKYYITPDAALAALNRAVNALVARDAFGGGKTHDQSPVDTRPG